MTIPEIEEALNKQRLEFEKLSKALSDTVENIKELRHQIGVPCAPTDPNAPRCSGPNEPPSFYNPKGRE